MINKAIQLYELIRRHYCPQRIYKYGKLGLAVDDDRTAMERLFDSIGTYLYNSQKRIKQHDTGFRPYFDWSLGLWINSRGAIKDIERQTGLDYVSIKDWEKESVKQRRYMDEKFEAKLESRLVDVVKDINQGRSFVKENKQKRQEIYQKYGKK